MSFFSLITELETLLGQLNTILSGAADQTVEVNGVTKDSISKAIEDRFSALFALSNGHAAYQTKAEMDAAGAPATPSMSFVWNDSEDNNGLYGWDGLAWDKSEYDPISYSLEASTSYVARNAGFEPIKLGAYNQRGDTSITTNHLDPRMVTIIKEPNNATGVWYGAWIEINYEDITDLDVDFVLDVENVSGEAFDTYNIVAAKGDWPESNNPVYIGSDFNGEPVNLYERILNSNQTKIDHYTAAKKLYIIVGNYTASLEATQAASSMWRVAARFNRVGKVVASDLASTLQLQIDQQMQGLIDFAVANIREPKAINKGLVVGGVHTSLANVMQNHKDSDGSTFAIEARVNTEANPYSYISFKVSEDYNDFITKRFRIYIESDSDTPLNVFVSNGTAWGSSDGIIGAFISKTFTPKLEDNFSGYVDIDIPSSFAEEFYSDPIRVNNQSLFFIVGLNGSVASPDVNFKVSYIDLDDYEASLASLVSTEKPFDLLSDKLIKHIPELQAKVSELADSIEQVRSLPAESATHAGVEFLVNDDVYPQKASSMALAGTIGQGGIVATKVAEEGSYTWYALKIAIHYDSLEDLNKNFYLGYEHISGEVPNIFNIVDGPYDDWNPNNKAVSLGSVNDVSVNLYEKIVAHSAEFRAAYEAQNVLYINVAFYNADFSIAPAAESEWLFNPHFEIVNAKVVATDLSKSLREELAAETDEKIAVRHSQNQYITCWGDSLTAGGGWTTKLEELSGFKVYNGGTGGENTHSIMARQGSDAMIINNITIPANVTQVLIADRDVDTGIDTQFGFKAKPLLQGGAHMNPVKIGDIEGSLTWTGASHDDMTGNWVFTRSVAGSEVTIDRPTQIRTNYDRLYNNGITVVFMGQNGGYDDIADLVWQNRKVIEHGNSDKYVVLGLSSGSALERAEYEQAMRKEFGRRFISLREYLAAPIYAADGVTIVSCYGLDDAGLEPTQADLDAIAEGKVPPQCLTDAVHYTSDTKTVIGNMLYKRMVELNLFES